MTWIVYRVIKDKRCTGGTRWVALGWINSDNEQIAMVEAKKEFGTFDTVELKLVETKKGCGWLM